MRGLHINYVKTRLNEKFVMYKETKQHLYAIPKKVYGDVEHHGIKGQKWGVRNGPPYPLDSSKSTGSRLKETKGDVKKKKIGSDNNVKTLSNEDIDNAIKNTKVNTNTYDNPFTGRQSTTILAHYKNLPDGSDIEVYSWPDDYTHVDENDIKKAARDILENKKAIKEACDLKIWEEEAEYWYVDDIKDKMSPREWLDNLDIRGVYVTDYVNKKGNRELIYQVGIEEKKGCKENLLGGHVFDCEVYINPKNKKVKVGYVAANG